VLLLLTRPTPWSSSWNWLLPSPIPKGSSSRNETTNRFHHLCFSRRLDAASNSSTIIIRASVHHHIIFFLSLHHHLPPPLLPHSPSPLVSMQLLLFFAFVFLQSIARHSPYYLLVYIIALHLLHHTPSPTRPPAGCSRVSQGKEHGDRTFSAIFC